MRGNDARNFAMINRNVMLLQSKHKSCLVTVILLVLFTRGMNADQTTINMRELIIVYTTKIFERISMMTLESGVVFVVRDIIRMIMHALTLQRLHIQLQRLSNVYCAATKKITVATHMVGIFTVLAAIEIVILVQNIEKYYNVYTSKETIV